MKHQIVLPACLLLLWTLTAFVSCADENKDGIIVTVIAEGITLKCEDTTMQIGPTNGEGNTSLSLVYKDEYTGEYTCFKNVGEEDEKKRVEGGKIYVKFRTCDNCIELDAASISGMVIGDVVATVVIGVAVYLIASQARIGPTGPISSNKKSSDRQHLVPNEMSSRSASSEHYQPLKHKGGQKDTYDVLKNRK